MSLYFEASLARIPSQQSRVIPPVSVFDLPHLEQVIQAEASPAQLIDCRVCYLDEFHLFNNVFFRVNSKTD